MINALIGVILWVIFAGIVIYLLKLLLDLLLMDPRFKQIAWILIVLVVVLLLAAKLLPALGLHVGL